MAKIDGLEIVMTKQMQKMIDKELKKRFEELKRENEELVSDKTYLINAAMDGGDKYHYTAHDIAYRDLERKCKALEADYIISNRELLVKQVEILRLTARIAELEAESERFTVHSDIERQDDKCSGHGDISNFPPVMGSGDGLGW